MAIDVTGASRPPRAAGRPEPSEAKAAGHGGWRDHLGGFLRYGQTARYAKRALGLQVWVEDDFLPKVSANEAARLEAAALAVRGEGHTPAVFVHGVLPRSGTNFVANALALHPDAAAFPRGMYEFPLLHMAPGAEALRHEFAALFPRNADLLERRELLAYLAGGWLKDLQAEHPGKRLLFKSPHVQGLSLFPHLFPRDKLVLCLRDGRDVLASAEATFKGQPLAKGFAQAAAEWRLATLACLQYAQGGPREHPNVALVRYEDLVAEPEATLRGALERLNLGARSFPFERLAELPVFGSSANEAAAGDARWKPVERGRDFKPVGRWQAWPKRRLDKFERLAGDALRAAGYA